MARLQLRKNSKNIYLIAGAAIVILVAIYIALQAFSSPATPGKETERYSCITDDDCVKYGSCGACANKLWAEANADQAPQCQLLLRPYKCICIQKKCTAMAEPR